MLKSHNLKVTSLRNWGLPGIHWIESSSRVLSSIGVACLGPKQEPKSDKVDEGGTIIQLEGSYAVFALVSRL